MFKGKLSVFLFFSFFLIFVYTDPNCPLYVSEAIGIDEAGCGTDIANPCKTLNRGFREILNINTADCDVNGVVMYIKGGVYQGVENVGLLLNEVKFETLKLSIKPYDDEQEVILDAESNTHIFHFQLIGSLTIENIKFRNGYTNATNGGGCLYIKSNIGDVKILDSEFTNCVAESTNISEERMYQILNRQEDDLILDSETPAGSGGALFVRTRQNTKLGINNCVFENNISKGGSGGGAIYIADGLQTPNLFASINNTVFKNNKCENDLNGGGAIRTTVDTYVLNLVCNDNYAFNYGGCLSSAQSLYIEQGFVSGNSCGNSGGALYALGPVSLYGIDFKDNYSNRGVGAARLYSRSTSYQHYVYDCVFQNNTAVNEAGAMSFSQGTLFDIYSCEFRNNTAGGKGGAIYGERTQLTIINNTYCEYNVGEDGGCISFFDRSPSTPGMENVIFDQVTIKNNIANVHSDIDGGGAVSISHVRNITIYSSLIESNKAPNGVGGAFTIDDCFEEHNFNFIDTFFQLNYAVNATVNNFYVASNCSSPTFVDTCSCNNDYRCEGCPTGTCAVNNVNTLEDPDIQCNCLSSPLDKNECQEARSDSSSSSLSGTSIFLIILSVISSLIALLFIVFVIVVVLYFARRSYVLYKSNETDSLIQNNY